MANTPSTSPASTFANSKAQTEAILHSLLALKSFRERLLVEPGVVNDSLDDVVISDNTHEVIGRHFWTRLREQIASCPHPIVVDSGVPTFDAIIRLGTLQPLADGARELFTQTGFARRYRLRSNSSTTSPDEDLLAPPVDSDERDSAGRAPSPSPSTPSLLDGEAQAQQARIARNDDEAVHRSINELLQDAIQGASDPLTTPRRGPAAPATPPQKVPPPPQASRSAPPRPTPRLFDDDFDDGSSSTSSHRRDPFTFPGPPGAELNATDLVQSYLVEARSTPLVTDNPLADRTNALAAAFRALPKEDLNALAGRYADAIPLDIRKDILCARYVDLGKIHAYRPSARKHRVLEADEEGSLVLKDASASQTISDGLVWLSAFDKMVAYALKYYSFRAEEFSAHRTFMLERFLATPAKVLNYIAVEDDFAKELGLPGRGKTYYDLPLNNVLLIEFLGRDFGSSLSSSSSRSGSKRKQDDADSSSGESWNPKLCRRFAQSGKDDHPLGESETACSYEHKSHYAAELLEVELGRRLLETEDSIRGDFLLSGTSSTPRLLRSLHFPSITSPRTPAVDTTLSDPPLPRPPLSVLNDPVALATLQSRPDLFTVSTPLHLDRLEALLAPHPNRLLVQSVLVGLREGFWPGHSGDFASVAHLAHPDLSTSSEDLDFLLESALADRAKGYLSPPFDAFLPAMHISPSFVVRPERNRARQVCDQTVSGLNDGIPREWGRTVYDTIAELGALMRYRRRRGDDTAHHVLWKSDVSGGFRNLPVSIFWQLRQIHRIRSRLPSQRFKWVYFVDQRLILGGRMAPRIFCTVMNLILWGARHARQLEFPMAFVDDAFGFDTSGNVLSVDHLPSSESRLVPVDQARLLHTWNDVGLPWDWKKQQSSSTSLVILGLLVHAVDFTVTLSESSVADLQLVITSFLAHDRPRLIDWQKVAGHLNWAATVLPFAKFALQCLYDKMSGRERRNGRIFLSSLVRRNVVWMVDELTSAPPLSLLDPALEEWTYRDAFVLVYTDACLVADSSSLGGLGFWVLWPSSGKREHFYYRGDLGANIAYAEALAIFSALAWLSSFLRRRRILLFSDSALAIYAFDSGRADDNLHTLVWSAYERLRAAGNDVRLRHIAGSANYTADALSRLAPPLLPASSPSEAASRMSALKSRGKGIPPLPPRVAFGIASRAVRRKQPHLSLRHLKILAAALAHRSLETGTRRSYKSSLRHWEVFTTTYGLPWLPTTSSFALFAAFLSRRVVGIDTVLSGVTAHFKHFFADFKPIRSSALLTSIVKGADKSSGHVVKRSPPIQLHHLRSFLRTALHPRASYDDLLMGVLAVTAFFGVMRLGELLEYPVEEDRDPRKIPLRASLSVAADHVKFTLPYHKADRFFHSSTVILTQAGCPDDIDVISLFRLFVIRRDRLHPASPFLFAASDTGTPLPRALFISRLAKLAPSLTGHAFRAGGATYFASIGVSSELIQRLGRWTSKAWEIYIRDHPALAAVLQVQNLNLAC